MAFVDQTPILPDDVANLETVFKETEPGIRQNQILIAGNRGRGPMISEFLQRNWFNVVKADEVLPKNKHNYFLYARNAFTQLGSTIFIRKTIPSDFVKASLGGLIEALGGNKQRLKIIENDRLADGGNVLVADQIVVAPIKFLDASAKQLIQLAGNFELLEMETATDNDFKAWRGSRLWQNFVREKTAMGMSQWQLQSAENSWILRTFQQPEPDLDLFNGLAKGKSGRLRMLVDEFYARLYPRSVERAAEKFLIKIVECHEAAILGCNFLQAEDLSLIPSNCPDLKQFFQQEISGNNVVDFPTRWITDVEYGACFRCLYNQIDLRAFK